MRQERDDLGYTMPVGDVCSRVVSLVPSLTEAIAATAPEALIGATQWCTHPDDLDVARVRGTKNPDIAKIASLSPDLVVANMEENRQLDVERLRDRGIAVWVTRIDDVASAISSMKRLFAAGLGWHIPQWLDETAAEWSADVSFDPIPVAVPIWRNPWMVVGPRTYTNDVLRSVGMHNVFDQMQDQRYPTIDVTEIERSQAHVVLLPDEPYAFNEHDGPEAFPQHRCLLVDGRSLMWYGPAMVGARARLRAQISEALDR